MINPFPSSANESVPDINGLLGIKSDCPCGQIHSCTIKQIIIRHGALNELPAMVKDYNNIVLVSDENTRRACADRVDALLGDKVSARLTYPGDSFVVPNEDSIAQLEALVNDSTDLIIGVGSGVINDLCKYVSFDHKLPYFIVATAPSMDGYASKGAAMILGNMKITTTAAVPSAIIADTEILREAPIEMLRAGYGDIIGKYSCLNDWRLSALVNGEPLCEYVYSLTYDTVKSVAGLGKAIASRDEAAVGELMRALVMIGIAMAYFGNSRPGSGSEHHLSHFFEVTGLLRDEPYFCHGIDVAYSTYVTAQIRKRLLKIDKPESNPFVRADYESNIRRIYGKAADGILELQERLGWIYEDKLPTYREKWAEIREILSESPTPEEILIFLSDVGLDIAEFDSIYSIEKREDAIRYAKDLKDRYTVLWMNEEIK